MPTGRRSAFVAALVLGAAMVLSAGAPAFAGAPAGPSLRLIAPRDTVTIHRYGDGPAFLDAGVLVSATRGDFHVIARRADYDHAIEVWRILSGTLERLPDDVADGFNGLSRFLRVTLFDRDGDRVLREVRPFCPSGEDVRVTPGGPLEATFPRVCFSGPFTLGVVWGIDRGWAVRAFGWDGPLFDGPDGRYTLHVAIPSRYRDLFGITDAAGVVTVNVRIKTSGDGCPDCPFPGRDPSRTRPGSVDHSVAGPVRGPLGNVPSVDPPADAVPDLRALPAWSISLSQRRGQAQVQFAATIWNAGPAPMLVEGFRRGSDPVMDAYQYFIRGDEVVGRARAGRFEYHRGDHNHWHFLQFARFSLWNTDLDRIVVSKKQAFCLAPTDAIDMTVPGADWKPGSDGLGTACGAYDPNAVWMRETLQAGWGDTYYQVSGVALEVTSLPNGVYFVAVEANPTGRLYETDRSNNVELRRIRLGGTPGHRTLRVFPWHGIDA